MGIRPSGVSPLLEQWPCRISWPRSIRWTPLGRCLMDPGPTSVHPVTISLEKKRLVK